MLWPTQAAATGHALRHAVPVGTCLAMCHFSHGYIKLSYSDMSWPTQAAATGHALRQAVPVGILCRHASFIQ